MAAVKALNRILTLDLLRGYFLLVIILNHLHYYPSGLEWITGESILYTSTAEGFFLISGIVLGIVRGRKLLDKPFSFATKMLVKRSAQLYLTSIILVLLFTFIGWLFMGQIGLKLGVYEPVGDVWGLVWKTLTFQYIYGWADYLRLYAIFILFSPLALWLLRKGLWYIVLLVSVFVWSLYPYSPLPIGEYSQPFSWQLIFFSGFILGFHWKTLQNWWRVRSKGFKRTLVSLVAGISIVTLIANVFIVFGHEYPGIGPLMEHYDELLSPLFNKDELPVPRLVLFALWFSSLYWLFVRFEKQINRFAGWILLPFGTNSLYVYTIQALLVFVVNLIFGLGSDWWFINLAISIGTVGIIYLSVRTKFLMKIIPR
jgi:hypothetical protein